ncbi:MAG: PAS domain-containing protein [Rhodospirillum sp.]|nr:PAS domain-containing protein [Rhodospirillum sp.]MCF8488181.1 PAS domain-containing protein [Rhodospirillum sp.]MCF8501938.1 PAS domain-containing protein [Rhodospirillum sp.]
MSKKQGQGRILIMVLGLGAIILANGLFFHALETTRRSVTRHDRAPALSLATSLSLQTGDALIQTDARLRLARDRARQADTATRRTGLRRVLRETMDYAPNLTGLAVRWEDGRVIAAGDGPLPGIYPKDLDSRDGLLIEGPILLDPATGTRILRLIRPLDPTPGEENPAELRDTSLASPAESITTPGTNVGGWIFADLALSSLDAAFSTTVADIPGAQATLVLGDGQILLHQPPMEHPTGYRVPGFPPGGHPVDGSVIQASREGVAGSPPTLAYRQVPGMPLWVTVSLPREPVLDGWWRTPMPWLVAGGLTALVILVLMGLALARLDERDRARRFASQRHTLLLAQTRLQRALLGTLPSPVVVIDARGRILQANDAFANWVGRPAASLRGVDPREILPDDPADLLTAPLDGRAGETRQLIWRQADGRARRVQANARALGGQQTQGLSGDRSPRKADRPVAKIVAFLDLTDGVSLAEDLTRAKSTLRTFAQAIAEDLRAPLGDMIGRMTLLDRRQGNDLDPDSRSAVHQAIAEGEHMRVLIDDILDYAKVALTAPPRTGVDSNAALEKALVELGPDIKESGADIRSGILPPVRCGEAQLASLLRILVGDAIERAAAGQTAKIRVDGTELDDMVTLTVTDGGGGPPSPGEGDFGAPPPRPKVGVGLALCGEILRHAGGYLNRSTARDGTTVQAVHLPAAPKAITPRRSR